MGLVKAILWLLGLIATTSVFVVGAFGASLAAQLGGTGTWGAVLVLLSACGMLILGVTSRGISHDWPRPRLDVMGRIGVVASVVIAVVATFLLVVLVRDLSPSDSWYWRAVAPLGVVGAWGAVFGWAADRRLLAAAGHLVSLFAPWGYFYLAPIGAIGLALAAGATFRTAALSRR